MKKIDWSKFTPEEICEAFNSMPDIAMPWHRHYDGDEVHFERRSLKWDQKVADIYQSNLKGQDSVLYVYGTSMKDETPSLELAKSILDKKLVDCGWKLMYDK